jgi:WD40 repeat protein
MGVVFLARQKSLNRQVALKMILAGQLANRTEVLRFHAEAEAAANLDHPSIVPIYEVGEQSGQHYFSMAFVDGPSLAQVIGEGPLPPRRAAELLHQIAQAVHYAHVHHVLHRDLKPANILIDGNGRPRVTDFGLAKRLETDSELTASGQIMGTPSYMSPEQAAGKNDAVGPAADVHALGAVLYCLLTGRPPFQAASAVETLMQVIDRDPVPVRQLNPGVPRDLETVCHKCLQKDPGRRYHSAADLADDLSRWLAGRPILARPVGIAGRLARFSRRNPAVAGLLAGIATLLVLATVGATIAAVTLKGMATREEAARKSSDLLRDQADSARNAAQDARHAAEEQAEDRRRSLYAARINLAHQAWVAGNTERVLDLLDSLRPAPGQADLRGFEWYYLWRLGRAERLDLKGQLGPVRAVAFAPDGKTVATASGIAVVICDRASGEVRTTLWGHTDRVLCLAYSPDGTRLASGSDDQTVRIWDVAAGRELAVLKGHGQPVGAVAFAPDGKTIASAGGAVLAIIGNPIIRFIGPSPKGDVRLWKAAPDGNGPWAPAATLPGLAFDLAFTPDGRTLITAEVSGSISLWNVEARERREVLTGHRGPVFTLAISPDGKTLATGGYDQTTRVWDLPGRKQTAVLRGQGGAVFSVALSPDGKTVASGGHDQMAWLWDVASQAEAGRIRGHLERIWGVAFSPDGNALATASEDGTARLWDPQEPPGQETIDGRYPQRGHGAYTLAFSPDSRFMATTNATLSIWDRRTGKRAPVPAVPENGDMLVTYSPSGDALAVAGIDGSAMLLDARSRQLQAKLPPHPSKIWSIAFSPDGKTLATSCVDGVIRFWDASSGIGKGSLDAGTGSTVRAIAYAPDGRTLGASHHVKGQDRSLLHLWDLPSRSIKATLSGHTNAVECLAFSPDGRRLVSGSWDRSVRLWDPATAELVHVMTGHMDVVYNCAFSHDSLTVASASWDGTVRLWHAATGQELMSLQGGVGEVWSVAFAADGRTLAAGQSARQLGTHVLLWQGATDAQSGPSTRLKIRGATAVRSVLSGHSGAVNGLAYAPDGSFLASGSDDRSLILWDPVSGKERLRLTGHAGPVDAVAVSPDSRLVASGAGDWHAASVPGELWLRDAKTGERVAELSGHGGPVFALAFTGDGRTLASGSLDGTVALWDVAAKRERARLRPGLPGWVQALAITPDGQTIAFANGGALTVWDVALGRQKGSLAGHKEDVDALAISPDGKTLASGSRDKSVKLWDLSTLREKATLANQGEWIWALGFTPDGKLAIGVGNGSVKLWDVGRSGWAAVDHVSWGSSLSLAVSPDGKTIASGHNPAVVLWRLPGP